MSYKKQHHGGNIAYYSRLLGIHPGEIIDYSANINPLGFPERIRQAVMDGFDKISQYPDPDYLDLKKDLANFCQVKIENVILGNGAVELIYLLANTLLPKQVLIPVPTFSEYGLAARSVGANVDYVFFNEENYWSLPVDKIVAKLSVGNQILFLCNPNNPTGNIFPRDKLKYLADKCREYRVLLVIDESFLEFALDGPANSLKDMIETNKYIYIISSLTKILGIPGLRIGYGLSNPDLLRQINRKKDPWNINCIAELAVKNGLADTDFLERTRREVSREKEFLFKMLGQSSQLRPYPTVVNFLLIKILKSNLTSGDLIEKMAKKRILIRDCSNFPGLTNKFIRIGVKDRANNQLLVNNLQSVVTEEG